MKTLFSFWPLPLPHDNAYVCHIYSSATLTFLSSKLDAIFNIFLLGVELFLDMNCFPLLRQCCGFLQQRIIHHQGTGWSFSLLTAQCFFMLKNLCFMWCLPWAYALFLTRSTGLLWITVMKVILTRFFFLEIILWEWLCYFCTLHATKIFFMDLYIKENFFRSYLQVMNRQNLQSLELKYYQVVYHFTWYSSYGQYKPSWVAFIFSFLPQRAWIVKGLLTVLSSLVLSSLCTWLYRWSSKILLFIFCDMN